MGFMEMKAALYLRAACLFMAIWVTFSGRFPPARAQQPVQETVESLKFTNVDKHLDSIDAKIDRQWARANDVDSRMTHMEGMVEGFGALFTLMLSGSIVFQVRKGAA